MKLTQETSKHCNFAVTDEIMNGYYRFLKNLPTPTYQLISSVCFDSVTSTTRRFFSTTRRFCFDLRGSTMRKLYISPVKFPHSQGNSSGAVAFFGTSRNKTVFLKDLGVVSVYRVVFLRVLCAWVFLIRLPE